MTAWTLNDVRIDRVLEFEKPLIPPETLLPDAHAGAIEPHRDWLEPHLIEPESGHLVLAFHSLLVRTGRHAILVDTCSGNHKQRPNKPRYHMNDWPYLAALGQAGVQPEEIDYVLCTHLHVDHVGWNTRLVDGRWVPTFPNAKYLISREEWAYWEHTWASPDYPDDPYYEDSLEPVIEAGQVAFVEDGHAFEDGVWIERTPGHTPGHVCLHIDSGGRRAVMSGDLMHHALQCAYPEWNSCFCVDAERSRRTRRAFLERCAETDALVLPAHFPTPTAGRVRAEGDGFRFRFRAGD